jgi:dolichol-phosphate mannosyltransferase
VRALVVVPTYNEVATIEAITGGALAADPRVEVLVVDDDSPDGTGTLAARLAAAEPRLHALHRPAKAGLGAADRAGFRWGLARPYDLICEMDADASHDPADLPRLLAALDGADVAIGSRYVHGGSVVAWPRHRRTLSRGGNRYVQLWTGLPVADATSGFRAYRREVLARIQLAQVRSDGYAFQVEMVLRAWRAGWRIVEVPITFVERREGSSKLSRGVVLEAIWRVPRWGLTGRRRPARAGDDATSGTPCG